LINTAFNLTLLFLLILYYFRKKLIKKQALNKFHEYINQIILN
jgi:hypothetical protein